MAAQPITPDITLAALAGEWRQLMCAAQARAISDADRRALTERADEVLARLVETPINTDVVLAAEILFRPLP